jgi:transposase
MTKVITVGCDLHDRSMLLKVGIGMEQPHEKSFVNDADGRLSMVEYLMQFARKNGSSRIVFVYEASGQGYGLYDLLRSYGIECYVLSPTHLPKTAKGKRLKTDARDAQMLFEQARGYVLAGNDLPIVWTPPQTLRDDRELVRFRLETAEACTRIKLQIFSMLKRYGKPTPHWFHKNRSWTRVFVKWLKEQADRMPPVVSPVLHELIARFEILHQQITELDRHLRHLAKTPRYEQAVNRLRELPGVGLITALTFLTEMGDLSRFHNRREVAAYLGLCPSSFESGNADDRKGHITRQGPGRVRKVLCQAAWAAIRTDEATRATWLRIQGNKPGRSKKAVVAIMRKLAIVMWHRALAVGVSTELTSPPLPPPRWIQESSLAHAG